MGCSEGKLGEVLGSDDLGLAQNHLAVVPDGEFAELPSIHRVAFLAGDVAGGEALGDVVGEFAEVTDVPPDVLDITGLDLLADEESQAPVR